MSNRSIKKRRHRSDFQQYMEQRELQKEINKEGPIWRQAGYPTQASFNEALAKAQAAKVADEVKVEELPHEHHDNCIHH